ncbi:hypothetical protein [Maridesulfovibrio hydrothermalis]|uniref:Uncharacterized protein n=1 Tax=Maridesulfovibrio hydrothermalis AM13 = DSM 14728 TaxID=1121451 RepID=L0RAD2_9BACT|nr:hypothetical protein [Maridesulfovibrio hydrothermalis]CCO23738.1 conserved protein of unknown function [Maridesulfovibrio hydrothermalis AM13 = DSM 14728]
MIVNKKEFTGGLALLGLFFIVLFIMFQPMFDGKNSMAYLDAMYNSISKGSVYYIPAMREDVKELDNKELTLKLEYSSAIQAQQSEKLFKTAGVKTSLNGKTLDVSGSIATILNASLDDADLMYHNDAQGITDKYGIEAKRATFNWWTSLGLIEKALNAQEEFKTGKVTSTVLKKAVETAYNYYEIEPMQIMDKLGLVIFSLAFYVFYTLWYGFAILFVFEGWGLNIGH